MTDETNTDTIPRKNPKKILRNTLWGIVSIPAVFFAGKGIYHASDDIFGFTEQTKIEQNLAENALETPGKIEVYDRGGYNEYFGSSGYECDKFDRKYYVKVAFEGKRLNRRFTSAITIDSTTIGYDNNERINHDIADDARITITRKNNAPVTVLYSQLDPIFRVNVKYEYDMMFKAGISDKIKAITAKTVEKKHIEDIINKTQERFREKQYQDSVHTQAKKYLQNVYK